MLKFLAVALVAVVATLATAHPFGKNFAGFHALAGDSTTTYIGPTCNKTHAIYKNFQSNDCSGSYSEFADILNVCKTELEIGSWKATCDGNPPVLKFMNFLGHGCHFKSILTRVYPTSTACFRCACPMCKNSKSCTNPQVNSSTTLH